MVFYRPYSLIGFFAFRTISAFTVGKNASVMIFLTTLRSWRGAVTTSIISWPLWYAVGQPKRKMSALPNTGFMTLLTGSSV